MSAAKAQTLPGFDFTRADDVRGWQMTHDISGLRRTPEGLLIEISGGDPYVVGPPRDFPAGRPLWMRVRMKSDQGGTAQIFYFRQAATEQSSVRFPVRAGVWQETRLPLPPLGAGYRFRIDPPGTGGTAIVASLTFSVRVFLQEPPWPVPSSPSLEADPLSLQSGDLQLVHSRKQFDGFALNVARQRMAIGLVRPLIGYLKEDEQRWLPLADGAAVTVTKEGEALVVQATSRDADGADWAIRRRYSAAPTPGAIDVETRVTVSQDRTVVFLPLLVIFPGVGSFGPAKGQGLLAGVEYLENEASSSEADLIGPASKRQAPDTAKLTFPLMAIQASDRTVGLIWEPGPAVSALFDSPDRLFRSGGHVMGLLYPGSDGQNRVEGSLLPYEGDRLTAGKPFTLRATLIGGRGKSVVPAVQQYVALRGLPPVPGPGMDRQGYVELAAAGWLDSGIRAGARYRHAYWPGAAWPPEAVPDGAAMMEWLARATTDADLARRLRAAAAEAIAQASPADWNTAGIAHVRYPVPSLIYGEVATNAERALSIGRDLLRRFEPDGTVLYRPTPGHPDFGRTHFAPDASGLTAEVVKSLLEAATVCGDPALIREGLRVLRVLDGFTNSVPRGAQTWEIPLHTPDILAAAHLVRAYTLGYELTGEAHFLDQARYWAWTGVPFTYLVSPTTEAVGYYATTPVLGATNWQAPVWIGLPVQWCGLVYADALYRLLPHDPSGPWKRIADGITASGIQQSWPRGDAHLQGLLPDSFDLRYQIRNPVAINPGTVQANATHYFDGPPLYDFHAFRIAAGSGNLPWLVHAPGAITNAEDVAGRAAFTVNGWPDRPYYLLVVGLTATPRVRIDGREVALGAPHTFLAGEGRLILRVEGNPRVEILTR